MFLDFSKTVVKHVKEFKGTHSYSFKIRDINNHNQITDNRHDEFYDRQCILIMAVWHSEISVTFV